MRRANRLAAPLVATVFVGASLFVSAAPSGAVAFGVSVLKDCQTPINVGDAYSCEFEISNTVQTSHNTVTVDQLTDLVFASGGTVTGVMAINTSTPGLILSGVGTVCDATKCTIPFGGTVTTSFMSHYTTVIGDFPAISDTGTFRWKNVCDKVAAGCSTTPTTGASTASADINPLPTSVVTAIHNAAHQAVTTVAIGSTVHDFVTVNGQPNQPNPTGNVNIDWFLNGTCSGPPAQNSGSVGPLDANGQFDATGFSFTVNAAGKVSFLAHYEGAGAYQPSTGVCEPLQVTTTGKHLVISGSMEGSLTFGPGAWVNGGYHFNMPAQPNPVSVTVTGDITVPVICVSTGKAPAGSPIHVPVTQSFTYPAHFNGWWLSGDQNSPLVWINAVKAPDLCNGGLMKNSPQGATFDVFVTAGPHTGAINFQFHYRIPAAKGKPNTDCTNTTDPNRNRADVCGASWSATKDP